MAVDLGVLLVCGRDGFGGRTGVPRVDDDDEDDGGCGVASRRDAGALLCPRARVSVTAGDARGSGGDVLCVRERRGRRRRVLVVSGESSRVLSIGTGLSATAAAATTATTTTTTTRPQDGISSRSSVVDRGAAVDTVRAVVRGVVVRTTTTTGDPRYSYHGAVRPGRVARHAASRGLCAGKSMRPGLAQYTLHGVCVARLLSPLRLRTLRGRHGGVTERLAGVRREESTTSPRRIVVTVSALDALPHGHDRRGRVDGIPSGDCDTAGSRHGAPAPRLGRDTPRHRHGVDTTLEPRTHRRLGRFHAANHGGATKPTAAAAAA